MEQDRSWKIIENGEQQDGSTKPVITIILIAINVAIFAIAEMIGSTEDADFMIKMGAINVHDVIYGKQFYRIITSMFLHFGADHLLNNMFMLGVLGYDLEQRLGRKKFLMVYLVSGIFASICSISYHFYLAEECVCAGASGAIYGIFGVFIVRLLQDKESREKYGIGRIVFVIFLLIYGSIQENIDFAAHIGGLLTGIAFALLLKMIGNCERNKMCA